MRRFLVSSLLLRICALIDPSRKSTGWFVVTSAKAETEGKVKAAEAEVRMAKQEASAASAGLMAEVQNSAAVDAKATALNDSAHRYARRAWVCQRPGS